MTSTLRVIKASFIIGWENESNWIYRPAYFVYAALRPFAMCLTLYFLFKLVTDNPSADPAFVAVYISNAVFTVFMGLAAGVSWIVIEDREWFRVSKYVYISPISFWIYILGRALLVLFVSVISMMIIIVFGILVLKLPVSLEQINIPYLLASFALGIVATGALGMIFAGVVLITARHSSLMAEGLGGLFLLLCGVIYPVDFLPGWMQKISFALPLTYWMEATRDAFGLPQFGQTLSAISPTGALLMLGLFDIIFVLLAVGVFKLCMHHAKKHGKIDRMTNY